MDIQEHILLSRFTTFRTGGPARFFTRARTADELSCALQFAHDRNLPHFILGGGSNLLISDHGYDGLVIKNEIAGIEISPPDNDQVQVIVGAGIHWDQLVAHTVGQNLWGLENLSWIPGTAGAAPVQNIGAYGTEVCQHILWVEAFDPSTRQLKRLDRDACQFGYRDSIFKHPTGQSLAITRIAFSLSCTSAPNLCYRDLHTHFSDASAPPTLAQIRDAIITIRKNKLPDTAQLGTAGSFFKNPIIPSATLDQLSKSFEKIPHYPDSTGHVKIPAAWLIDHVCHLRATRLGPVGTYPTQALAIVNYGHATSQQIFDFSQTIRAAVLDNTGISLEREVQLIGAF